MTAQVEELPPGYPLSWEADVVLRDGSVAHVRPIKPSDGPLIEEFHSKQSDESIYLRFFAPLRRLSAKDLHRFTHVDYVDRVALVATVRGDIVGIGRYDRVSPTSAEVAFNISDHFQGRGIGSVMLEHLAAIAEEDGITRFVAEVLPQNRKMLAVFSEAGYNVTRRFEDGIVSVSFDIAETEASVAVRTAREHRAEAKSMSSILTPRSIAVIGASTNPDAIGHLVLRNIVENGFTGSLAAVNAKAPEILGVPSFPRVGDVPDEVDLAIVAVPARNMLSVVEQCADKGVRSLLVISSGFAESGDEGARLQAEVVRTAHASGMRVLGPNSFGVVNLDPEVRLNASIAPRLPASGGLGLFAQSGALGIAVLDSAARRGLGVSVFASAGNRADVSGNDFMHYWIDDAGTRAVGLYLESMGNPRKFSRIARQLASRKPVIVTASGFTAYGLPPGHQVRESPLGQSVLQAIFGQAGVIRTENTHQLFDIAQLVCGQPLPAGPRVAVVANSDALSSLTAQAVQTMGLQMTHGPVSIGSEASPEEFREALDRAAGDPDVDSVVACFIPPLLTEDEAVAAAVRSAARTHGKPVLGSLMGMRRGADDLQYSDAEGIARVVPVYSMPEDAVRALAQVTRYSQWRSADHGELVAPIGIAKRTVQELIDGILGDDPEGRGLSGDEAATLLGAYGVPVWRTVRVLSADDAARMALELGYPVVLKSTAERLRHQISVMSIRVDLGTEQEVRTAYESLDEQLMPGEKGSIVMQRMASTGVACVVRSTEDPLFGPVVSFSIAGAPTELLDDVEHRIPPMTDVDVRELIGSVKAAPLLRGYRGAEPVHAAALEDLVARVSVLAEDHPEIAELVLNPVQAHPGGADVLGAEIRIAPAPQRRDASRRAL
ncbi:GNAT family N-acetyltransferase [Nostocoides sp. F2B08]|uniref:bifunctional acetate--CoA ligase family protein/GNAT family N-acetyltransferase n=1 Tax=Nostocoides sp. F2B08 TaxID=2653936 RepID=UPI0012634103|nr:GNAT family N-acetyltransferase [Tetrasphaera sp. F2B08]KAB7742426.1 GNAT family N-acetyltransferase [Tetrasphaera sp. F2B08]